MIRKTYYITLICILVFGGCSPKEQPPKTKKQSPQITTFEEIQKTKKLKVAILNNSTSYFLHKGTPMGFHYELINDYAKHLGVDLSLDIVANYQTALKKIQKGECDILASCVNITGSRKKKMLFTSPIFRSNPVLVQNKNSTLQYVEDWLDVDTLHVAITGTTTARRIVKNLEEDLGLNLDITTVAEADQEELIDQVAENTLPATFADKVIATASQTYHPDLDISISAGLTRNMAWAANIKSKNLIKSVNNWLNNYRKTYNYKRLYTKYFRNEKSMIRNKTGYNLSEKQLSNYDTIIKQEALKINWDWRLLSALIYTESRFDPKQTSWSEAFGLMQLMPNTAKSLGVSQYSSANKQIEAGVKLLHILELNIAKTMSNKKDIKYFVLGAYNSGAGHIADARRLAEKHGKDKDSWEEVAPYILKLRQPKYYKDKVVKYGYFRGRETVNHVSRIMNLYEHYKGLFPQE